MSNKIAGKKIFILDDDIDFVTLLTKILETAGAEVISALKMSRAIDIFEEVSPHLLLLDLKLDAGNDGFQFVEYLKGLPENRQPSIIIISAKKDPNTISKFSKENIEDFIVKPISSNIVLRKIKKVFSSEKFKKTLQFDIDANINLSFDIDAQITSINELGCYLEMPIKLAANSELQIESKLFNELDISDAKFISTGFNKDSPNHLFLNEVSFIGLDEKKSTNIRRLKHFK